MGLVETWKPTPEPEKRSLLSRGSSTIFQHVHCCRGIRNQKQVGSGHVMMRALGCRRTQSGPAENNGESASRSAGRVSGVCRGVGPAADPCVMCQARRSRSHPEWAGRRPQRSPGRGTTMKNRRIEAVCFIPLDCFNGSRRGKMASNTGMRTEGMKLRVTLTAPTHPAKEIS